MAFYYTFSPVGMLSMDRMSTVHNSSDCCFMQVVSMAMSCSVWLCMCLAMVLSAEIVLADESPELSCYRYDECPPNYYCELPEGTCALPKEGTSATCQPVPEICTREYRPVCGCNGTTYPNRCEALAKGQAIKAPSACEPSSSKPDSISSK